MNFTYLFEPDQADPDQEVLQRLDYLVVVFVMTEAWRTLILDETAARMKASRNAGCWVVTREHLDVAPRSSVLRKLDEALRSHPIYASTGDHNFIAWVRRSDFARGDFERGQFAQLELGLVDSDAERAKAVLRAVSKVLDDAEKQLEKPNQDGLLIKLFAQAVGEVVKRVIGRP